MSMNNFSKDNRKPDEREIKIPDKGEVQGKRNPKRKDKDYERKYGDKYEEWN